jgi:hypothetical protein
MKDALASVASRFRLDTSVLSGLSFSRAEGDAA